MPQADEAAAALAADGEGFDQDVVERFARFQPPAKLGGLVSQLLVGHRLVLRLQRGDRLDLRLQALEEPRVGGAEQAGDARSNRPRMALPMPETISQMRSRISMTNCTKGRSRKDRAAQAVDGNEGARRAPARRSMRKVRNVAPPKSLLRLGGTGQAELATGCRA